jgi:hypothetical protein
MSATSRPKAIRRTWLIGIIASAVGLSCVSTRGPSLPERASAPDFTLSSHQGKTVHLADELKSGPVVLVFYRGFW